MHALMHVKERERERGRVDLGQNRVSISGKRATSTDPTSRSCPVFLCTHHLFVYNQFCFPQRPHATISVRVCVCRGGFRFA